MRGEPSRKGWRESTHWRLRFEICGPRFVDSRATIFLKFERKFE
jgi:hypothetical protein